jgi:hypothetical protein
MRAKIEALADKRGETISLIVREAVSEYLAKILKRVRSRNR